MQQRKVFEENKHLRSLQTGKIKSALCVSDRVIRDATPIFLTGIEQIGELSQKGCFLACDGT